jgi:glutamyl-tRNA synthetase
MMIRTRFAPSPTGYLHVGGARTALFCWLFARKHGGKFVLRIEDTDKSRNTDEATQAIFDGMKWLGLDWDEGPFYQSERKDLYDKYFAVLKKTGRVYESDGAWRFRFERKPITMNDLVCGEVTIDYSNESNTPDMVIKRSDGSYVFHFVNVVDDLEMQITHVIRGEDHLMNTPKHLQLFEALGVTPPIYGHIPLILNSDGSKMSKRDEGAAVADYPKQGFLPEAVVNFLVLLGWSPKTEEEIFSLSELIERFTLEAVNRAPAKFDREKCAWFNQQYLQKIDAETFASFAKPFVLEKFPLSNVSTQLIATVKDKVRLFSEVPNALSFFLTEEIDFDQNAVMKVKTNTAAIDILAECANEFSKLSEWSGETAKEAIQLAALTHQFKIGQLMFSVRIALSGRSAGPDLVDLCLHLGRDRCVKRLNDFVIRLNS